jgi:hypothetical protein
MVRRGLLVILFVVLAGCTGGLFPSADESPTSTTTAPLADPTPTATDGGTTGRPTAGDAPARIWPDEPIVVAVEDTTGSGRDFVPLARDALDYWRGNATRYLGYPVEFVLEPGATDPDVEIRVVRSIDDCNGPGDAIGCAPYITNRDRIDRPVSVDVVAGLSDESTIHVMKHELGHVFGLDHGDPPRAVMAPGSLVTTLPRRNATDRPVPWENATLTVHLNDPDGSDEDRVRRQVGHALDYYDRGAGGTVPENASFELVDEPAVADVVISFPAEMPCGVGDGSCGRRVGVDVDGDGALEYYTRLEITLTNVDPAATAWHVAYWLGYAFGFEEPADWPAPLRNASGAERRSEWWADDAEEALASVGSRPSPGLTDDRGLEEWCEESDEGRFLAVGPDGTSPRAVRGGFAVGAGEQRLAVDQEDAAEIPIRDGV